MANRHRKGDVAHAARFVPAAPAPHPIPARPPLPDSEHGPPTPPARRVAHKTLPRRNEDALLLRFGEIVRQVRNRRAFSQKDLAERAQMNRAHISLLEAGKRESRLLTICALAAALRVNPGDLMPITIQPTQPPLPTPPAFPPPLP